MAEATISLDNADEALALFGSRDQFLRQLRDTLRVKIISRNGDIRLEGEQDRVALACRVFEELRKLYRRQRTISPADLSVVLDRCLYIGPTENLPTLELRESHRHIRPRSDGQTRYLRALRDSELVFCAGPAGTGKTYLAVAAAVAALRGETVRKIVLVRPAVEAGERLGFLPGDLEAKINPYLRPLLDALNDFLDYNQLRRYLDNDLIEIAPLAYMRGRTLNDAVIILDEGQNCTVAQMKMFLTRMGQNARIVVTGDPTQVDLPPGAESGLVDAVQRLRDVPGVAIIFLDRADIVRHPLVQAIVDAYERPDSTRGEDAASPVSLSPRAESPPAAPRTASLVPPPVARQTPANNNTTSDTTTGSSEPSP